MCLQEVLILVNQPIEDANDAMFPSVVLLYFRFIKQFANTLCERVKQLWLTTKRKTWVLTLACSSFTAFHSLENKQTEKHPRKEYIVHP